MPGKLSTYRILKSGNLSTNFTVKSAVTGLSDWIKQAAAMINMTNMNFMFFDLLNNSKIK